MNTNQSEHHRRSIRIPGYDYRQPGYYVVTICVQDTECHISKIINKRVVLNQIGLAIDRCWQAIPDHFARVKLDAYVIMPNHLHGIINLRGEVQGWKRYKYQKVVPGSLASVVRCFKMGVIRWCRAHGHEYFAWHRNYHENIIRSERGLEKARWYIKTNPANWGQDRNNPEIPLDFN